MKVISKWMNCQMKNDVRDKKESQKESVLHMRGSRKHEVNSHDTVQ